MTNEPVAALAAPAGPAAAKSGNDIVQVRAREAAEALFKPKASGEERAASPIASPGDAAAAPAAPQRKPRIIAIPPAAPPPEPLPTAAPPASERSRGRPRDIRRLDESEYGRIRTLATHGMTLDQVAELYGVDLKKIERIVGMKADEPR